MLLQKNINSKELFIQLYKTNNYIKEIALPGIKISCISFVDIMNYGFADCKLTSLNLSNFDTTKIKNTAYMFYESNSLESVDLSNLDTSEIKSMGGMFYDCKSLKKLDLSNFNTSEVELMQLMFFGCTSLETLDLSNFDLSKVKDTRYMFESCDNLKTIIMKNCNQMTIDKIKWVKPASTKIIL